MKYSRHLILAAAAACLIGTTAEAASLTLSLGIRETGDTSPIFGDGSTAGGIEWVNKDATVVPVDGTWNKVTFNFQTDPLTPFAGATADGLYTGTGGIIEHIRILNSDGITNPIDFYVDEMVHTNAAGASTTFDWDSAAVGSEVMFQEPSFSGSTSANILAGSASGVTDTMAHDGSQSYLSSMQFVDGTTTRWVRLTTFAATNSPDPIITFDQGDSLSFWVKATSVPEPTSVVLAGLAAVGLAAGFRRK